MAVDPKPASASSAVLHGILNGLAEQKLVPGQRLIEVELAEQYRVSRNSVREALQQLAAQGVVDLPRNKGAVIRSLSLRETLEVLDVAERMTGLLARSAAVGVATGAATDEIRRALDALDSAHRDQDAAAFARSRRDFYRALLQAGGSRELRRLFPTIQIPIVYAQHRPSTLQTMRIRDYHAVAEAVLAGDAEAADAAGMVHVRNVRAAILAELPDGTDGARAP